MSWPTCMTLYFDELNCNNHQIVLTSFDDCRDHSVIPAHPPLSWSYTKLLYHQQTSAYCLLSNLEDHSRTVKTVVALKLTPDFKQSRIPSMNPNSHPSACRKLAIQFTYLSEILKLRSLSSSRWCRTVSKPFYNPGIWHQFHSHSPMHLSISQRIPIDFWGKIFPF